MTTEAAILRHVKRECKRLGLRYHRIHVGPGSEAGWPDVEVLGPGRILFMETKAPGKPLRPLQLVRRTEITAQYGHLYCKPDTKPDVTKWLELFKELCDA